MSSYYRLSKRLIFYGIILIVSFILFLQYYPSLPAWLKLTNFNSALSTVSTLVQSEAAVLGIVVTLSLVAVQLTASSYSTRVINIFKYSFTFWFLVLLYLITIIYSIAVLKFINPLTINEFTYSNNEFYIWLAYILGIYSFTVLIPYILEILEIMEPKKITNLLAEQITKKNIDNYLCEKSKSDPIQPVMDILTLSLMKNDYGTLRDGLNSLKNRIFSIIDDDYLSSVEEDRIIYHIFDQLLNLVELSKKNNRDEFSILLLTNFFKENGIKTAEKKLRDTSLRALTSLFILGKMSVEENLQNPVKDILVSLEEIGLISGDNGLNKSIHQSIHHIESIGVGVMERKLHMVSNQVVESLEKLGLKAAELELKDETKKAIYSLERVGRVAGEHDFENNRSKAVLSIEKIGRNEAEKQRMSTTLKAIHSLDRIGGVSVYKHKKTINLIISALSKMGKDAAEQKIENTTLATINVLVCIGINVVGTKHEAKLMHKIIYAIENVLQLEEKEIEFSKEITSYLKYIFLRYNGELSFNTENIEYLISE